MIGAMVIFGQNTKQMTTRKGMVKNIGIKKKKNVFFGFLRALQKKEIK